jgi:hypothetical protein
MLKTPGKLVDLDWKKELMEVEPSMHTRRCEKYALDLE